LGGTGASLYTDMLAIDRKRDMEQMQAKDTYELSRMQALAQPQTAYQAPYGTIGCYWQLWRPIGVGVCSNYTFAGTYPEDWFKWFGHRSEGLSFALLNEGYIRGQLVTPPGGSMPYGKRYDELAKTLSLGIRIKRIPEE
jgi:hypothetical protein